MFRSQIFKFSNSVATSKARIWLAICEFVNESDPRSNVHYLGSSENKAWKKFRPVRDLNHWPLRYQWLSYILYRLSVSFFDYWLIRMSDLLLSLHWINPLLHWINSLLHRITITSMISDQNYTTRGSITTLLHPFWNYSNTGLSQFNILMKQY